MPGFDFGSIGGIVGNIMDTDEMDICRADDKANEDGSSGLTDPQTPKYTGVSCHISFSMADNPDPTSVGTAPVIMSLTINCADDVDLQSGDYVYARKLDGNGGVIGQYKGTVGKPAVNQARKSAVMAVKQG